MPDPIAPVINALHAEGRLRVWSLVITVFGDLVQPRGGAISTTRLGRIMSRIGVEPGALRTALSRLGQDGWVTSTRKGRSSIYRLSAEGLAQTVPATSRIYAPPRSGPVDQWCLTLHLDDKGAPRVALCPAEEAPGAADADVQITGSLGALSARYRAAGLAPGHRAALAALAADLDSLGAVPDTADPLTFAVARMLLIHRWRRLVLRHGDLPAALMPADTPLAAPRHAVAKAYGLLSAGAEAWCDLAEDDLTALPPADASLAARFALREQT